MTTTDNSPLIEQVWKYREAKPKAGRHAIAKHFKIGENQARGILQKLDAAKDTSPGFAPVKQGITQDFKKDTANLSSLSPRIKTLEDLLAATNVNLAEWEVERWVANKWEMGIRLDESIKVEPLWQVKAWLRRRKAFTDAKSWVSALIAEYKKVSPVPKAISYAKHKDGHLFEPSIPDLHLGKLAWKAETQGEDWDVGITETQYQAAVEALIARASSFPVSQIVLPIGNDFFNVDNEANTTSAGTPQNEDGRWQKSFLIGKRMMVWSILRFRQIAPVKVVMVAGNHDTQRLFYLGDTLQSFFAKTPGVEIDNTPPLRKYVAWGKCLIGFTHGKEEKIDDLPLIMATERADLWAASDHREIHLGHWHSKKDISFKTVSEKRSCRIRILPSLSPPDAWHAKKGYSGARSAEAYLWHPKDGCVGYLAHNI